MAGGQTELEVEMGAGRRTEGLPGSRGQVRLGCKPRRVRNSSRWGVWLVLCNRSSFFFLVATIRVI